MVAEPFSEFARFYDWIMHGVKYEMWASYIRDILRRYGIVGKDLLDLACGTGNSSFALSDQGFTVTGLDRSQDMLRIAREKAMARAPGPAGSARAQFVQGDLRTFDLGRKFDVITCLYDSLNYLLEKEDVHRTFKQVRKHLKDTGAFIFDVNTEYQLARVTRFGPTLYERDDVSIFWRDEWHPENKIWRIRLDGFVKEGDMYRKFQEIHEEKAYSIEELEAGLLDAGLSRVHVYNAYSFEPPRHDSGRLYFVSRP